jgi:hypothetical protein
MIMHYNTTLLTVQTGAALNRRAETTKPPSGVGIQPVGLRPFSAGPSAPRPLDGISPPVTGNSAGQRDMSS